MNTEDMLSSVIHTARLLSDLHHRRPERPTLDTLLSCTATQQHSLKRQELTFNKFIDPEKGNVFSFPVYLVQV